MNDADQQRAEAFAKLKGVDLRIRCKDCDKVLAEGEGYPVPYDRLRRRRCDWCHELSVRQSTRWAGENPKMLDVPHLLTRAEEHDSAYHGDFTG